MTNAWTRSQLVQSALYQKFKNSLTCDGPVGPALVAAVAAFGALLGAAPAGADPSPPPAPLIVPGSQSTPLGPMQYGQPFYVNGPARAGTDARAVGIGTIADLGGPTEGLPNAHPGGTGRSAMGIAGAPRGVGTAVLSPPAEGPGSTNSVTSRQVPTVGLDGHVLGGLLPTPPGAE